jgi:uncharacterized SAM-binding protein YcdF (DUF218 family)
MYQIVTLLLRPDTLLLLATAAGLAWLWWKRRETRRRLLPVTIAFALLWLICTPLVGHFAAATLDHRYPPLVSPPADAEAIVILSGYARPADSRGYGASLTDDSIERCLMGAELHQRSGLPVVVTGGIVDPAGDVPPLGVMMRDFLLRIGVAAEDITVEQSSRTTYENAAECAKLMDERGWQKIVLVTHDRHMPRAVGCFQKAGFDVVAAPVRTGGGDLQLSPALLVPSARVAAQLQSVAHEWLGILWYWWHGRI